MLKFRKKQNVKKDGSVTISRVKTTSDKKREMIEIKLKQEFNKLSKSDLTPREIALRMSQLRSELEDELLLTVEELKIKRSKRANEMLSKMNAAELYELFTEYFVNSRLEAAKEAGTPDLELEELRLSSEAYVIKLMSMSMEERLQEFDRLDKEKMAEAKKANDENLFKFCLAREIDGLRKKGVSEEDIKTVTNRRTVDFVTGSTYPEEELETARLELEYKDLTTGTSYIIDHSNMSTVLQSLYLVKSDIELRKLVASRKR